MEIFIKTEFIRLDAALKFANEVSSGGQAKMIIQSGYVLVNNNVCTERGKKLRAGDTFTINKKEYTVKNEN